LNRKTMSIRFSALLVLTVITFSFLNVQFVQVTPSSAPLSNPSPPPPSSPSWTYTMSSEVRAVAVSADGKSIVAAGHNSGQVYLFQRDSNTPVLQFDVSSGGALNLAISADGNTTVVGRNTGDFYAFCNKSSTALWHYYDLGLGASETVAVSSDGSTIAVGTNQGRVYIFSRTTNTPLWFYHWGSEVVSVAVSGNGSTIVAGFVNDTSLKSCVCEFGRASNSTIWKYKTDELVYDVAISEDGNTTATATGHSLIVFSRADNATILNVGTVDGYAVAVSGDGSTIAIGEYTLWVFRRTSSTPIITGNIGLQSLHRTISVSYDGSIISCGTTNATDLGTHKAFLFSKTSGQLWNYSVGGGIGSDPSAGRAVGMSADGCVIAYGSEDKELYVFLYDTAPPLLGAPNWREIGPAHNHANITITLPVNDNFAVSSVILHYKLAGTSTWNSAAMTKTGAVYNTTIGPYSFRDNITYYVNATDFSNNYACKPGNAPISYYNITVATLPPQPTIGTIAISEIAWYTSGTHANVNLTFTVPVTDTVAVSTVTLYYKLTGATSWSSTAMSAQSTTYNATVGPFSVGDIVDYYVNGTDALGNFACNPSNAPTSYYNITVPPPTGPAPGIPVIILVVAVAAIALVVILVAVVLAKKKSK
jgi:hypothetical protein